MIVIFLLMLIGAFVMDRNMLEEAKLDSNLMVEFGGEMITWQEMHEINVSMMVVMSACIVLSFAWRFFTKNVSVSGVAMFWYYFSLGGFLSLGLNVVLSLTEKPWETHTFMWVEMYNAYWTAFWIAGFLAMLGCMISLRRQYLSESEA